MVARDIILDGTPRGLLPEVGDALGRGREHLAGLPPSRWQSDAYHRTLFALKSLLDVPRFELLQERAWQRRALFALAAGWTELRHDTILYGEPYGAECSVPEEVAVPCWVEPVPELYGRLSDMVKALEGRLKRAGIDLGFEVDYSASVRVRPLSAKTKSVAELLDFLKETALLELKGEALDDKRRDRIMVIGGEVEWILTTLARE